MLWIQSRVDYILKLPQILSKRTAQQQQAQPAFIILQRVWILQSLNTTLFNSLGLRQRWPPIPLLPVAWFRPVIERQAFPCSLTLVGRVLL